MKPEALVIVARSIPGPAVRRAPRRFIPWLVIAGLAILPSLVVLADSCKGPPTRGEAADE
jgi:hypothetical protein